MIWVQQQLLSLVAWEGLYKDPVLFEEMSKHVPLSPVLHSRYEQMEHMVKPSVSEAFLLLKDMKAH
jgi:hypothetical protein